MAAGESTRVLFVCLGNICRSPTAHGVLLGMLETRGLSDAVEVDSCGTGAWHVGSAPDPRAVAEAATRGYDLRHLRARQVQATDFGHYHYVLAMDNDNLRELQAMCPAQYASRVGLLLDHAKGLGIKEVPDPYYGGDDGFSQVLDMVEAACEGLLEVIQSRAQSRR